MHGSQSVRARVVIDNASGVLRPGQFVTAASRSRESKVALAVENAKRCRRFRDFDVVFEQVGDTYEVRMLELGRADADARRSARRARSRARGTSPSNSYLIKADIEKSGASHDH